MTKRGFALCIVLLCTFIAAIAQEFDISYIAPSTLKGSNGEKIGKGDQLRMNTVFKIPLSMKRKENGAIRKWDMTFNAKYAHMDYEGIAGTVYPDEIINSGAMLTHVRSLGKKWNMVASLGVSLNAIPDHIRWQNITLSGGLIFMYSVSKELHIGIGTAVTTQYDTPLILPLPYIAWNKDGKYRIELNMRGVPEIKISTDINERMSLAFKPFMMQRETAVMEQKGKDLVYSMNSMGSTFTFQYKISKRATWVADAGYIWRRTIKINERSWKGFWDSITDDDSRSKFKSSFIISTGIRFDLK